MTKIPTGLYRHYKNKNYRVVDIAKDKDLNDIVIYEALYENDISKLWVQPVERFLGKVYCEGESVPRFTKID